MTYYTLSNSLSQRRALVICLALMSYFVLSFTSHGASSVQAHGDTYIVQRGDTLSQIAKGYGYTTAQFMNQNGLDNPDFIWVGQMLHIPYSIGNASSTASVSNTREPAQAPAPATYSYTTEDPVHNSLMATGRRWIEVDVTKQLLTAWEGDTAIMSSIISGGTEETPTVLGRFYVDRRLTSQRMRGEDYDYPDVPWVMYFFEAYAIHGAYWHNAFGTPRSHGCVNMTPSDAQWLYEWSSYGTEIYVHE